MIIKFPDGNLVDLGSGSLPTWTPTMVSSAPIITFFAADRVTVQYQFVCNSAEEQVVFFSDIYQAIKDRVDFLEFESDAGLPTNGSSIASDLFLNGDPTALPITIANNQELFLTIGSTSTTPSWPPGPTGGVAMPASFLQNGLLTIDTQPVQNLQYVNGLTLRFRAPVMPAGTYDITYTDGRGSVTLAAAVTYV